MFKGHVALGNARFPKGTSGKSMITNHCYLTIEHVILFSYWLLFLIPGYTLDILARAPLWKYGLDYRHGTGHGVGSYLFVHEGK